MTVTYENNQIVGVGDVSLTAEERRDLADSVDRAASTAGDVVASSVAFARRPVEGYWRLREEAQILPVPPHAPKPPYLLAPHPLVLQVRVSVTHHQDVNRQRIARRNDEVRSILSIALRDPLFRFHEGLANCWTLDADGSDVRTEFRQGGYALDLSTYSRGDLHSIEGLPELRVFDTATYYSRIGVGSIDPVAVPVGLAAYLDAFAGLASDARTKFLNACHWYLESWSLSGGHTSRDFVCLVTAVEALVPDQQPGPPCATCGKPSTTGPSRAFRDFLEANAPAVTNAHRSELYRQRSKLAHGQVQYQNRQVGPDLRPDLWDDFIRSDYARVVVRAAILNWLCGVAGLPEDLRLRISDPI